MKRVIFTLSMGLVGCRREDIHEFNDDATEEEIEEAYLEWRENYLDGGWEIQDD